MNEAEKFEYATVRMKRAKEILDDAKILIDNGSMLSANNRIYYAIFNAVCALLVFKDVITKNHTQAIGLFNKLIVNTGIIDRKYGRFLNEVKSNREKSDYTFEEVDETETKENYAIATEFIKQIGQIVENEKN